MRATDIVVKDPKVMRIFLAPIVTFRHEEKLIAACFSAGMLGQTPQGWLRMGCQL
jgi:hypothetical protein